ASARGGRIGVLFSYAAMTCGKSVACELSASAASASRFSDVERPSFMRVSGQTDKTFSASALLNVRIAYNNRLVDRSSNLHQNRLRLMPICCEYGRVDLDVG
ncbi:MAG: hypothetical protein WEB58_19500, partial [Planctomycetaceae bacterium]